MDSTPTPASTEAPYSQPNGHTELHAPALDDSSTTLHLKPFKGKMETAVDVASEVRDEKDDLLASANKKHIVIAVFSLALGMVVSALDTTIVATMLPTIARDFDGASSYAWVGTAYLLTSTALSPIWGKLSDIFGRKRLLTLCMIEFVAFSVMAALSTDMVMLIIARAMQGIGGGGLQSLTIVIIGEIVSARERGKYQGIMSGTIGVAAVVGPIVGGIFTDHISWRWGFWINVPIGVIAAIGYQFALKIPPPSGTLRTQVRRVDYIGVVLLTISVTCMLLACTWGGTTYPWSSGQVLGNFAAAFVFLVAFLYWEMYPAEPIVPFSLFRDRNYSLVNVVMFVMGFAQWGLSFFVPVYFQDILGATATESGIQILPLVVFLISFSIFAGVTTAKTGRIVEFPPVGFTLMAVGMGLMSMWNEDTSKVMQVVPQCLVGMGMGMTMAPATVIAQVNSPLDMIGPGTTVAQFVRSLGGVIGLAVFSTVYQNVVTAQLPTLLTSVAIQYKLTPQQIQLFKASISSRYSTTGVDLSSISQSALDALRRALHDSYSAGIHWAFISDIPCAVLGCLVSLLIRHVKLREVAAVQMEIGH